MRARFRGKTYRLIRIDQITHLNTLRSSIHNGFLLHQGSVEKQELQGSTLQVYWSKSTGTLYACRTVESTFINDCYTMSAFDLIPVMVPAL